EWAEDTLGRSQEVLVTADIYDAVYASLFTYDQNSDILQVFCEVWCPKTNTILTFVDELSISLWDLHTLGGLPIRGSFYEEVIPEATQLICVDAKDQRYIPRVCEYLFTDFHYLQESKTDSSRVSLSRWIGFWYKKALRYEPAPPRREKKTASLKFMHNPTGAIPETFQWSRDEEGVFSKLGVRLAKKEETYLAAFLSCWLCAFMLPSEEGDFIRLETFKTATMMATKRKISLAVPVLASIYSCLSKKFQSSQLDLVRIRFPIHYVYGWLAHYFKTHYAFANGPSNPPMVAFPGDGVARYYDKRKHGNTSTNEITLLGLLRFVPISTKISEVAPQGCSNATPRLAIPRPQCSCYPSNAKARDLREANLAVLEIPDSVDSPLRTLTVHFKESNYDGALPRGWSQESGESVSGPNPIKSSFAGKTKKEATSIHRNRVRARLSSDLQKHPTAAVSAFDGKKGEGRDIKVVQKREGCRSPFGSHRERIEEAKIGVSTTDKDFDACNDADLLNDDDLTDLEQKRERLEAMRQDLINYKLCLD
ncbi:hypothetical protein HAX54_014087, partial [Datura stramonium]|nr:hypothetical protein [Datura stramonium]